MTTQSQLRQAMAAATTGAERNRLAAELAEAERAAAVRKQAAADLEWADTAITATLTPVAVYSPHTAASDWLGEVPDPTPFSQVQRRLIAEASLWYTRLPEPVRADEAEFRAQAHSAAKRAASRLGMHPGAAVEPWMDYVSFLRKRAASGLPQIDQTIDPNNMPSATPYPPQVFDNFAPEVDPVNAGVSGTETSMRAPIIQELSGGGAPAPQGPAAPASGPAQQADAAEGLGDTEAEEDKGALTGTTAVNHLYNLGDFLRATGAQAESDMDYDDEDIFGGDDPDEERDYAADRARRMADEASPHNVLHRERDMARRYKEQQYEDDKNEYGEEYANLIHGRGGHEPVVRAPGIDRSRDWEAGAYSSGPYAHTGASTLDQIQQTTAPDGVTSRPTAMPTEVAFPWEISEDHENPSPPADGEMSPAAAGGHQAARVLADQWRGQEGTWHPEVQPDAANNPGTTPPPATGAAEAGRAAAVADAAANDTAPTWADASSAAPEEVRAYSEAYRPAPVQRTSVPPGMSGPPTHPRLSHALSTPAERAHPDYAAGYAAGVGWKASAAIPGFGSQAFEAGLYAGILDNPAAQGAFVEHHRRAAAADPAAGRRIARHASVSAHYAGSEVLPGIGLNGPYLRITAGTSTDLDTMAPGTSADPTGNTPFNGPGRPGPLDGQYGAAEPGGPPPYQGAPPYGTPVVPTATEQGSPVVVPDTGMTTPNRAEAFRRRVQANLARANAGAPLLTTPTGGSL